MGWQLHNELYQALSVYADVQAHVQHLVTQQASLDLMGPQAQQLLAVLPAALPLQPLHAQGFAAAEQLLHWPQPASLQVLRIYVGGSELQWHCCANCSCLSHT